MQPIICRACDFEFENPEPAPTGAGCPRCGEPIVRPAASAVDYLTAVVTGAAIGALAACILFLARY